MSFLAGVSDPAVWALAGRTAPTVRPVAKAAPFFRNPLRLRCLKSMRSLLSRRRRGTFIPPDRHRHVRKLHDGHFDVVDRGQRIEQAVPFFPPLPPDPELTGGRS